MDSLPRHFELCCPKCNHREDCGPSQVVDRLRAFGKLRRNHVPDEDVLYEVFRGLLPQMPCPACGDTGLTAEACPEDTADWPTAVSCQRCGRAIHAERLAAIPGTRFCAACQEAEDRGEPADVEYCPRCGALLEIRPTRGSGTTRYAMFCTGNPPCRL